MTAVLLINPPSPYLDNAAAYPPMGLLHVAAAFEREGCKVSVLDLAVDKYDPKLLKYTDADLVGITCVTPNVDIVADIVAALPRNIPIMVGGIHPTIFPNETLALTGCSFVVSGEIEKQASHIMSEFKRGTRIFNGGIATPPDICKPARHLVDLHKYTPGGEKATPVYTSRGCPFSCAFCSKLPQSRYREIPIMQVMDEIEYCIGQGFRKIVFGDDNLGINPKRLRTIIEMINPLNIAFRLNMDARKPDERLYAAAYESGCNDISFGIESGSQKMLDAMNKQTTTATNALAIKKVQRTGMKAKAYFMVNFPGETEETVRETLAWAEACGPDNWLLSSFAPLPGSDTWMHPQNYGITWTSNNWGDYYLVGKNGSFKPCFETDYLTKEKQIELHDMMWNGLKEVLG